MSKLQVPIIGVVIGEGGSGGALAIGVADRVLMLENATYSVITPEGCAAILWKDAAQAPLAAEYLRLTAPDLMRLGVVDQIVPEPGAGAHEEHDEAARLLDAALRQSLEEITKLTWDERRERRYKRLRAIGGQSGLTPRGRPKTRERRRSIEGESEQSRHAAVSHLR
jgi:acetyl-CoA carboxylase carboxyl transferase alpha subunit